MTGTNGRAKKAPHNAPNKESDHDLTCNANPANGFAIVTANAQGAGRCA